jgi:arylsulfatase A-like enzyme
LSFEITQIAHGRATPESVLDKSVSGSGSFPTTHPAVSWCRGQPKNVASNGRSASLTQYPANSETRTPMTIARNFWTLPLLAVTWGACAVAAAVAEDRPNVLWLTSEDNGISWVSCYGGTNCKTPAIDQLAAEGFRYTHCFDNAAVCAPTRSTWITGMYAISNGTQPMRSRNEIPHETIPYYPDLLREAGYHTSNSLKTDYNIGGRPDNDCWDVMDRRVPYSWRERRPGQPFFAVVNTTSSHESRAHGDAKNTRNNPAKMQLASYHPDLPAIRRSYAKYADAVENMDHDIHMTLEALKADGLYDDTIIIYNSDHGGVMPRSKRFLYSSGVHCPLIIRIPEKYKHLWPAEQPGTTVDRLVSFVDMPKTWLSLAGARIPDTLQGTIFLGKGIEPEPKYHLSFRERADDRCDSVRMIRDNRYAYHEFDADSHDWVPPLGTNGRCDRPPDGAAAERRVG